MTVFSSKIHEFHTLKMFHKRSFMEHYLYLSKLTEIRLKSSSKTHYQKQSIIPNPKYRLWNLLSVRNSRFVEETPSQSS